MKRRDFIRSATGIAGILATGKFPNILYGQVEAAGLATDPVVSKMAQNMGLDIDKGDITFEKDYDKVMDDVGGHGFAKLYAINEGPQQGNSIQVFQGLPMVRPTDGALCIPKYIKQSGKHTVDVNTFTANIADEGSIEVFPLVDQPNGATKNDYARWNPVLKIGGVVAPILSGPVRLPVDPINPAFSNNVIEWDYGVCKRWIRVIQGRIKEMWVFTSNPNAEIRVEHKYTGKVELKLGRGVVGLIAPDTEVVTEKVFAEIVEMKGYPVVLTGQITVYPDAHEETATVDGWARESTPAPWATLEADLGSQANDTATDAEVLLIQTHTSPNWIYNSRGLFLWDTSSLPDNCNLSSGIASLYGTGKNDLASITPGAIFVSSAPAINTAVAGGDYDSLGSTAFTSAIAYAAWNTAGYNNFTLTPSGLAAVSKTSITKFGLKENLYDYGAATPVHSGSGSQISDLECYYADQGSNKPKLVIETQVGWAGGYIDTKDGASGVASVDAMDADTKISTIDTK